MILAFLLWIFFIGCFALFIYKAFRDEIIFTNNKINWYIFSISSLSLNLFVFYYVLQEKTVYIWDYKGYWEMTMLFTEQYFSEPFIALDKLFQSIRNDEYNFLPSFFLSPFLKVFGVQRSIYILSVINLFLLPGVYSFLVVLNVFFKDLNKKDNSLVLIMCVFFPAVLSPLLYGYVSAAGLVPMSFLVLGLYKVLSDDFKVVNSISIVLLFSLTVFLRRWLGIWCLATFVVFMIALVFVFLKTQNKRAYLFTLGKYILFSGATFFVVIIIFKSFFFRSLGSDYSDIYSAYATGTFSSDFLLGFKRVGLIYIIVAILGMLFSFKKDQVWIPVLVLSHIIITIFLFNRIQTMGIHHNYVLVLDWLLLISIGVVYLNKLKPLIGGLAVLCIVIVCFLVPQLKNHNSSVLFSNVSLKPNINPNMNLITDLYYFLNDLTEGEKQSLYVIASDVNFNNETLRNFRFPEEFVSIPAQLGTKHVDKRDGLPIELITKAKYVVVSDQAKLHLGESDQWVVKKFNDWIYSGRFSDHYKTLRVFNNDYLGEVVVKEQVEAYSRQDIDFILQTFKEKYSGYYNLISISELDRKIVSRISGDHWAGIDVNGKTINDLEVVIYPGSKKSTSFVYNLDSLTEEFSFKASQYNKDLILEQCGENGGGDLDLIVSNSDINIIDTLISWREDTKFTFQNLQGVNQLKFEIYSGESDVCDWFKIFDFKESN